MRRKTLSLLLALFVLVAAVPAAVSTSLPTSPIVMAPLQDESLPDIYFINPPQLSNDTTGATNVQLTLYFNNSLLDLPGGGQGLIKIGFTGLAPFNVTGVTLVAFKINGVDKMSQVVNVVRYQQDPTDPNVQSVFIYVTSPIAVTDNVTIILGGLKNPTIPGTYTISVGTYVAGNMRSSGVDKVVIKGPKPPLNLPKPFLIGWHYNYSECGGCSPDEHYDILDKTFVKYLDDGPVYTISYPLHYTLDCDESRFDYNVYAWNLSYQNLTFKGMKIFVDNEFRYWLPAEYFQTYKECVLISDGKVSHGVITEDFTTKVPAGEDDYLHGWTLSNGFEHAEPADMVVYYNRGYGWALTTYPTSYQIDNNSYIMTDAMPLIDGTSADVKTYTGTVNATFSYALALDPNVTVTLQYMVYDPVNGWGSWTDLMSLTEQDNTPYSTASVNFSVSGVTMIKFRFVVTYTNVDQFTKPGFALFSFNVINEYVKDCDTFYAVNELDNNITTLFVYNLSQILREYLSPGMEKTIELEAIYELHGEQLEKYDPIQVATQDFTVNRSICLELGLCDVLRNARYIVEGGGSWAPGSPQPYYGWSFDANQNPVITTGHGTLAADNLGVLFYLSQAGANASRVIFDDNPQYVDLTTGEMPGLQPGDIVILVGGSGVNLPLGYYEYTEGVAPVVRRPPQNGMYDAFVLPNGTVVEWAGPDEQWYDVWEDVFVIQWFTTDDGVLVLSIEGSGVDGTVAASWLVDWITYRGYGCQPLPPSGYIVGKWYEDVAEGFPWNLNVFAPAWIRGAPDDVNGFSTGDDILKIEYMSDPGLFGLEPGDWVVTYSIPSCNCYCREPW
ncbi:DUF2808 domain-containing protein [Thermococcus camini]|uniref:Uncharacterized protein n=1 Tax=Thermococcus camini TaxID=2016373 RepID=A0A7G2D839_9EURY|nr:DUF2808 domain-containing protein [Thermococcus camini]CAD5243311.1 conserved exported protein of unknown function [Thermococcus camini]